MKRITTILAATILLIGGTGIAYAANNTDNDRVLRGDKLEYVEYFKQDAAGGKKNYLYTTSEVPAPAKGQCLVVTANSEQTIAVFCNTNNG